MSTEVGLLLVIKKKFFLIDYLDNSKHLHNYYGDVIGQGSYVWRNGESNYFGFFYPCCHNFGDINACAISRWNGTDFIEWTQDFEIYVGKVPLQLNENGEYRMEEMLEKLTKSYKDGDLEKISYYDPLKIMKKNEPITINNKTQIAILGYNAESQKYSTIKDDIACDDILKNIDTLAPRILGIYGNACNFNDKNRDESYDINFLVSVNINKDTLEGVLPLVLPKDTVYCIWTTIQLHNREEAEKYIKKCIKKIKKVKINQTLASNTVAENGDIIENFSSILCNGFTLANPVKVCCPECVNLFSLQNVNT